LGLGVGVVAPSTTSGNPIIGNTSVFGQADAQGVATNAPELAIAIGTACVADTGTPTLNVQLQAAADDGTGNPDTWVTLGESGAIAVANLTANTLIARLPYLPPFPDSLRPRFLSLNFEIPAGTNFSAGTIAYALVTTLRDQANQLQAAKNYTVNGPY
jgi:hypothetical protein